MDRGIRWLVHVPANARDSRVTKATKKVGVSWPGIGVRKPKEANSVPVPRGKHAIIAFIVR